MWSWWRSGGETYLLERSFGLNRQFSSHDELSVSEKFSKLKCASGVRVGPVPGRSPRNASAPSAACAASKSLRARHNGPLGAHPPGVRLFIFYFRRLSLGCRLAGAGSFLVHGCARTRPCTRPCTNITNLTNLTNTSHKPSCPAEYPPTSTRSSPTNPACAPCPPPLPRS